MSEILQDAHNSTSVYLLKLRDVDQASQVLQVGALVIEAAEIMML
jgi:hypothetical protein